MPAIVQAVGREGPRQPECSDAERMGFNTPAAQRAGGRRPSAPGRSARPPGLRVDFVVHRSDDIGSPRLSGSTRASNAGRSPGSRSAARLRPPPGRRARPSGPAPESSSSTPRHRGLPDRASTGHRPDPAMTQGPRLSPHQEPPLPLIQVREDRLKLRRQHPPSFVHGAHPTPACRFPWELRVIFLRLLLSGIALLRDGLRPPLTAIVLGSDRAYREDGRRAAGSTRKMRWTRSTSLQESLRWLGGHQSVRLGGTVPCQGTRFQQVLRDERSAGHLRGGGANSCANRFRPFSRFGPG